MSRHAPICTLETGCRRRARENKGLSHYKFPASCAASVASGQGCASPPRRDALHSQCLGRPRSGARSPEPASRPPGWGRRAQGGETEGECRKERCGSPPLAVRAPRLPSRRLRGARRRRKRSAVAEVTSARSLQGSGAALPGAEREESGAPDSETDFESKLLTTSAEYYRSKVAGWTAACARFSQSPKHGKPQ